MVDAPRRASRASCLTLLVIIAALLWRPRIARAGPPLIADDPNTVGGGVVQPILAASVFHQRDQTLLRGPILDLTAGAVESLDITLIASLQNRYPASMSGSSWQQSGLFVPGLKWELLSIDRASVAFSPAVGVSTRTPRSPFFLLPIQAEFRVGQSDWVLGFDIGYAPVVRGGDRWFVAPYGRYAVTRAVKLLVEVWSLGSGPAEAVDLGGSVGVDAGIGDTRLRLLGALGTGFVSFGRARVTARAYLGLQYPFARLVGHRATGGALRLAAE